MLSALALHGAGSKASASYDFHQGAKNYSVYLVYDKTNAVAYVGITRQDLNARLAQHGSRFARLERYVSKLTYDEARAIETLIIERNPHLQNWIRSLSPLRAWYSRAMSWARSHMSKIGKSIRV